MTSIKAYTHIKKTTVKDIKPDFTHTFIKNRNTKEKYQFCLADSQNEEMSNKTEEESSFERTAFCS